MDPTNLTSRVALLNQCSRIDEGLHALEVAADGIGSSSGDVDAVGTFRLLSILTERVQAHAADLRAIIGLL